VDGVPCDHDDAVVTTPEQRIAGHDGARDDSPAVQLVDRFATRLGARASVSAVYGEPIDRGDLTIIPVARVSLGFGVGAGRGGADAQAGEGGGGGGGATAIPLGYIEIRDGTAKFRRILHPMDVALPLVSALLAYTAPPLLRRLSRSRGS
jgi:uncharacterized spore protein YtfJ